MPERRDQVLIVEDYLQARATSCAATSSATD